LPKTCIPDISRIDLDKGAGPDIAVGLDVNKTPACSAAVKKIAC
jgi:hypothetical protein